MDELPRWRLQGISDLKIGGLYDLARWEDGRRAHLSLGLSAPTGSIDEKSGWKIVGYGMQLGSGTWDFHPAITYLGQTENYSYGAQLGGILRIGDNDQGYTLGNRVEATVVGSPQDHRLPECFGKDRSYLSGRS